MRFKDMKVRLVLSSMLVMLMIGVSAATANAEISYYEWKVKGAWLESGSRELTLKNANKEVFIEDFYDGGGPIELRSTQVKLAKGAIVGGRPGKFEGRLELENLTATIHEGKTNCELVTPTKLVTGQLAGEIVESAAGKKGLGKTALLITANPWAEFTLNFKNPACPFKELPITVRGSTLAEVSPQFAEAKVGHLLWGAEQDGEYRNSKGEFKLAGITYTALKGGFESELVSKEVFGAF
jgi:hypothetical protein